MDERILSQNGISGPECEKYLLSSTRVVPSEKQKAWFELEQYAFIHFGVNTFTGRQWGDGTESPSVFDPAKLDCDQWVSAIKTAGLKGMVLTAKHHDGFCLWPSAYTEHSVKNSPCGFDVVKEASDACRRGGIRFGFYLSPWDRNSKYYGTPAYNDYYCDQLTELLTNYGEIFYVWFDNACAEAGKQAYDFPRYFELIHRYQPNAVIFNDFGPDIRWCGNESGSAREAEWAVVPTDLCRFAEKQAGSGPMFEGALKLSNSDSDIGGAGQILKAGGLAFVPSEVDTSIREDWFWVKEKGPKSLDELFNIYLNSVGHNACLNLNVPPDTNGLLDERDVKRLEEYGALLRKRFSAPVNCAVRQLSQDVFALEPERPVKRPAFVTLREDLDHGQRIAGFEIFVKTKNGEEKCLYRGNTVGHKQICRIPDETLGQIPEDGGELLLRITQTRGPAVWRDITLYE